MSPVKPIHKENYGFKCFFTDCKIRFKSMGEGLNHIREHNGQTLCPYENCGIRLISTNFDSHIKLKHSRKPNPIIESQNEYGRDQVITEEGKPNLVAEHKFSKSSIMEDQYANNKSLDNNYVHTQDRKDAKSNKCLTKLNPLSIAEGLPEVSDLNHFSIIDSSSGLSSSLNGIPTRDSSDDSSSGFISRPTSDLSNDSYNDLVEDTGNTQKQSCREDEDNIFQCTRVGCNEVFSNKKCVQRHEQNSHNALINYGTKVYNSDDRKFNLSEHFVHDHKNIKEHFEPRHRILEHNEPENHKIYQQQVNPTFPCTHFGCNKVFAKTQLRSQHIYKIHNAAVKIKCSYEGCNSVVRSGNLARHVNNVHKKMKKQCFICGKWISTGYISTHSKLCNYKDSEKFRYT